MHIQKALQWCQRYATVPQICAVAVIVYALFFTDNSVVKTYGQEREIDALEAKIADAQDSLEYYQRMNASLNTSPQMMERIVREQYHMQKPDEDVYLFE